MEQIINMSNELIAVIVNVIFFFVIYGTIFYILGVIIIGIVKTVYVALANITANIFETYISAMTTSELPIAFHLLI